MVFLVGGACLLAVGILTGSLPGRGPRFGMWVQALGVSSIGLAASVILFSGGSVGPGFSSDLEPRVGLDGLSSFFLLTVAVVAAPALVFGSRYLDATPRRRIMAPLSGLFVAALLLVLVARDVVTFLAGWELMTLLPAAVIVTARPDRPVRRATLIYLAITHLGGAGVWICLLLLWRVGAIGSALTLAAQGPGLQIAIGIAALIGFGTKAGLMPMHSWLPRAHPVAPAHISALMSGVMIKVALYGLIRVLFEWAPPSSIWLVVLVLVLGALSAVGGVLYALFQHDLKRLLAFHSIENVGIITLALGAALLFRVSGQPLWAAFAFAAALLHTLNHAVFKGLLFLGAGAVERATRGHDLDHLGGLFRRMPVTGAAFLVGSMAIAGLPPLNGFASEWLTLQSLLHVGAERAGAGWTGPLAAGALAMTAAMAVLCFVKVVGLVLLGSPRRPAVRTAEEVSPAMRHPQIFLAVCCAGLGVAPGLLMPSLLALGGEAGQPLRIDLLPPGTGGLPSLSLAALAGVAILLVLVRGRRVAAPAPAWTCGQAIEPDLSWTSSAFTKPLRLSFEQLLRPTSDLRIHHAFGLVQSAAYSSDVPHLFDTYVYGPVTRWAQEVAGRIRRLQSGSLGGYALHLALLVVVLLALARLGWGP